MTTQECVDYLIVNEGFGAVCARRGHVRIRFRPFMLTEEAFCGVGFLLFKMPWRRAVASIYLADGWRDEILPWDCIGAVERIKEVVLQHQPRLADKVLRRMRPLHGIPRGSGMDWVFSKWRENPQLPQLAGLEDWQLPYADGLGSRYAWIDAFGTNCDLVMAEVGSGFPEPVRRILRLAVGKPLEAQADGDFGRYCVEAYGKAARTGEPLLEDIDAIITPVDGQPVRRRYSRLILPFRVSPERARLLGISFENPTVNLRRRGAG